MGLADIITDCNSIVFVHGFTGHPEQTWTQKKANLSPPEPDKSIEDQSKSRKRTAVSSFPKSRGVFWPRDLLQHTIPNARVLTFGYDSHVKHWLGPSVNKSTVYDIAWDFLVSLEANRRQEPSWSSRPLVFVAHSLGGIIVKEALRRSHLAPQIHFRMVCESTVGIIFFGTPHGGADPRNFLCNVAEKLFKAVGVQVNEQVVNTLLPSSERLRELRDEFTPIISERGWVIHSFQEQYGIRWLSGKKVL